MSGGKHILLGETYPDVIQPEQTIQYYDTNGVGYAGACHPANLDALNQLIDAGVDFRKYNYDQFGSSGDRNVDFVMFYYREFKSSTTGPYYMNEFGEGGPDPELISGFASILAAPLTVSYEDGDMTIAPHAGSTNFVKVEGLCGSPNRIRNKWQFLAVAAHEWGHHLGGLIGIGTAHIGSIGPYGLMDGTYHGHWLMDGYMRYKLGWINPTIYDYTGGNVTVTLGDAAIDGSAGYAIVKTHIGTPGGASGSQYFILEGRNKTSTGYTQRQPTSASEECCKTRSQWSGLLVTHIREGGIIGNKMWQGSSSFVPRVDPEIATGMLDTTTAAPDPELGFDLLGARETSPDTHFPQDLFHPGAVTDDPEDQLPAVNTFAPYTSPSTDLYKDSGADPRRQNVYSGIALHNVRATGPGGDPWSQIKVDLSFDYNGSVPATRGTSDTLKVSATWQGQVLLCNDLVVKNGVTLTAQPGVRVVAATNDRLGGGKSTTKSELAIRGRLIANGTTTLPIQFVSSRDERWEHFAVSTMDGDGENTPPAAGNWYGVRFDLPGCENSEDGTFGTFSQLTSLQEGSIEYSHYGVKIENFGAPTLKNILFQNISGDSSIYLDKTDVFIPRGYWSTGSCTGTFVVSPGEWNLKGKTHVVASTGTPMTDASFGTSGKVDLIPNGPLSTNGSDAAGDSVYFRPATVTNILLPTAGADWGGLILPIESSGSQLRFADLGYAANPIFLSYPDGTTIKRSRIHHFADVGLWAQGSGDGGVVVDSCIVDRGSTLERTLGDMGVFLDKTDQASLLNTQVLLLGLNTSGGGVGISVRYGKTFCETTPPDPRTLTISNCDSRGPGKDVLDGTFYTGIKTDWICGSLDRDIDIMNNYLDGWKFAGMEFYQSADLQVTCNKVIEVNRGFDVYRDSEPTGTSLRLRENHFRVEQASATFFAGRTNNNARVKLGPANLGSLYGLNRLTVNVNDTKLLSENDPVTTNVLNAQDGYWYTYDSGSGSATLITNSADITSRLVQSPSTAIDIAGFKTMDGVPGCNPAPGGTILPPQSLVLEDAGSSTNSLAPGLPTEMEVGFPFPNPARTGSSMMLAVPEGANGEYGLDVFDVSGRRIGGARRQIESAGRYTLRWAGRDERGRRVSPGVYFLRVSGPDGFEQLRRVIIVR